MAVTKTNNAAGGVNGTAVTTANSGGASGDAFDEVLVVGGTSTATYDNSLGLMAVKLAPGPNQGDEARVRFILEPHSHYSGRVELQIDAWPTETVNGWYGTIVEIRTALENYVPTFEMRVDAYGALNFISPIGWTASTADGVVPTGTLFAIDWDIYSTADGTYTINLYADTTASTPIATITGIGAWTAYQCYDTAVGGIVNQPGEDVVYWFTSITANAGVDTPAPPPANNDLFADAWLIDIGNEPYDVTVTRADYTDGYEAGEQALNDLDGYSMWGRTAWWKYSPAEAGQLLLDTSLTAGFYPDTAIKVFTGGPTIDSLTPIAFTDGDGTSGTSTSDLAKIVVPVTPAETYFVQLAMRGYSDTVRLVASGPPSYQPPGGPVAAKPFDLVFVQGNDNFTDAEPIDISVDGDTTRVTPTPNVEFTVESPSVERNLDRTGWWSYTPLVDGLLTVDSSASEGLDPFHLTVYTGANLNSLTAVYVADPQYDPVTGAALPTVIADAPVTAGVTYYIHVGSFNDGIYRLAVTGPATVDPGTGVFAPPITTDVELGGPNLGLRNEDAVPFDINVEIPAATPSGHILAAAPIDVIVYAGTTSSMRLRRLLLTPEDGAVIPLATPTLVASLVLFDGDPGPVTVDIQYDDDAAFTSPVTYTLDVDIVTGINYVNVAIDTPLPNGTYFWRLRTFLDGTAQSWTPARSFTIDPTAGSHTIPLDWTVATGPTDPHLWYVTPDHGIPGAEVAAIGHGFPTTGQVTLSGADMTVTSWQRIPATPAAVTDERTISRTRVDTEHDEVVAVVPNLGPPGGQLRVKGDDA